MPKYIPKINEKFRGTISRYDWVRRMLLSGVHLNCTDIAERCGCTPKTAQRYINRLRAEGYRIEYDNAVQGFIVIGRPPKISEKKIDQGELYRVLARALAWVKKEHPETQASWIKTAKRIIKQEKSETSFPGKRSR